MAGSNTQKSRLLQALRESPNGLTTMDLMSMCSMTRPANVIHDLRDEGYDIKSISETGKNKYGEPVWFVRYQLVGDVDD